MAELSEKPKPQRGRIFFKRNIPPEELARRKIEITKIED